MRGRSLSKVTPPAAGKARAKTVVQPDFVVRGWGRWVMRLQLQSGVKMEIGKQCNNSAEN